MNKPDISKLCVDLVRKEVESLRQQLEELTQEHDNHPVCCCIIKDDKLVRRCKVHANDAEAQAQKLTEALEKYGNHIPGCASYELNIGYSSEDENAFQECDCGYDDIAQEALPVESKESTTYECEHAWVKHIGDTSAVCSKCGMPESPPDTWVGAEDKPDLSKCPGCGGLADNGHDRCDPPNVYSCTKCTEAAEKKDEN